MQPWLPGTEMLSTPPEPSENSLGSSSFTSGYFSLQLLFLSSLSVTFTVLNPFWYKVENSGWRILLVKGPGLLDQIYKARKKMIASSFIFFFGRLGAGTFHLTRAAGLQALSRTEMLLQVHFHNPTVLHLLFAFTHKLVVVTKKKACLPNKWHFISFSTGE